MKILNAAQTERISKNRRARVSQMLRDLEHLLLTNVMYEDSPKLRRARRLAIRVNTEFALLREKKHVRKQDKTGFFVELYVDMTDIANSTRRYIMRRVIFLPFAPFHDLALGLSACLIFHCTELTYDLGTGNFIAVCPDAGTSQARKVWKKHGFVRVAGLPGNQEEST